MADKVAAGHVGGANGAREAVCIHTKKIYSSCRDKDCIEDLRFYPTATAQSVLSTAQGLRGGSAELLERRGTLLGLGLGKLGFQGRPVKVLVFHRVRSVGGDGEGECQR